MGLKSKPLDDVRPSLPVSVVQQEVLKRVNLNVPETQRDRWKVEAIKRKVSLADMIIEAVEAHILT